ncbi:MAG TPA: hypothetical protein VFF06_22800 [Polyangia bacterium]|nr:hypothetical protein [Polyangia bacterium]
MRWFCAIALLAGRALAAPLPADARLGGAERVELQALVDDAAQKGLPDALLADKVREGLAKNVPAPRIVQAVRALASSLESARVEAQPHVVGAPSAALLKAIVDARALGAGAAVITVLASSKTPATQTRAVEVLADLAQRGYPIQASARTIAEIVRRPAELERLTARAESLLARGVTRTEALDALQRSSAAGLGLDGAAQLLHRTGGDVGDGRGPSRETSGPRGPNGNEGNNGNGNHGHGKP